MSCATMVTYAPTMGVITEMGLAASLRAALRAPALLVGATQRMAPAAIRQRTMALLAAPIAYLVALCAAVVCVFVSWATSARLRCRRRPGRLSCGT